MKAIVTGGAGFIGTHLVEELILKGAEVHVLDNTISEAFYNEHSSAVIHTEDIRGETAKRIILQLKPDVIFHLAAQPDVERSIHKPQYDADVNINGTINVLEAGHEAFVKNLVFSSTSAVYGSLQKDLITEEDVAIPTSYYGLSKLTAESYIRLFGQMYGIPYTILRYGNVYGPGQLPKGEGGVITVFIDKIKNKLPLSVHGDGEQTRDFIYVKDVIQANIAAMGLGHQKTIQISTAQSTSINQLLKMLKQIHGSDIDTVFKTARKGDIKHSCLDNKRARQLLKWQPKVDIFKGLKETYNTF